MDNNLKVYGLLVFGIVLITLPFLFSSPGPGWSYQEDANASACAGNWHSTSTCARATDGDWDLYGSPLSGDSVHLYLNYTKPADSLNTSLWLVKDHVGTTNLTIPAACWNYDEDRLIFRVEAKGTAGPCIDGDTEVLMPGGTKKIRDMKAGDIVYSYNENLGVIEEDKVLKLHKFDIALFNNEHYYIYTDDNLVKAAWDHPFYADGKYVIAKDLKVGQKLLSSELREMKITKIEIVPHFDDFVWDITVERNHNFFANGILVHNDLAAQGVEWTCNDGDWSNILRTNGGGERIYEEAMWWNITEAPADTCTCAGAGSNWEIDMSDYCNITTACNLTTGTLSFTGTGATRCNATISTTDLGDPGANGIFYIQDNCLINID